MIEYIKGSIIQINPAFMVLETGGIGYSLNISVNTFSKLEKKIECRILVHELIREDTHQLFGFADEEERKFSGTLSLYQGWEQALQEWYSPPSVPAK
jgi:holliday junction DNA helicase RuvA